MSIFKWIIKIKNICALLSYARDRQGLKAYLFHQSRRCWGVPVVGLRSRNWEDLEGHFVLLGLKHSCWWNLASKWEVQSDCVESRVYWHAHKSLGRMEQQKPRRKQASPYQTSGTQAGALSVTVLGRSCPAPCRCRTGVCLWRKSISWSVAPQWTLAVGALFCLWVPHTLGQRLYLIFPMSP